VKGGVDLNARGETMVAEVYRQVLSEAFFVSRFDGSFGRAICLAQTFFQTL
jgi:hypothetical protein